MAGSVGRGASSARALYDAGVRRRIRRLGVRGIFAAITVQRFSASKLVRRYDTIDLVDLDVQGEEFTVIYGAMEALNEPLSGFTSGRIATTSNRTCELSSEQTDGSAEETIRASRRTRRRLVR